VKENSSNITRSTSISYSENHKRYSCLSASNSFNNALPSEEKVKSSKIRLEKNVRHSVDLTKFRKETEELQENLLTINYNQELSTPNQENSNSHQDEVHISNSPLEKRFSKYLIFRKNSSDQQSSGIRIKSSLNISNHDKIRNENRNCFINNSIVDRRSTGLIECNLKVFLRKPQNFHTEKYLKLRDNNKIDSNKKFLFESALEVNKFNI
jgi:hypothetical protein